MEVPLQIHFKNMDPSPALESAVRERISKLEKFADHVMSCRVTIEAPHRHRRKGKLFHVMIDLRIRGGEIVASRSPGQHHAHEDAYVALRDAFKATQRQLRDRVRVTRGHVKNHEIPPHGRIVLLNPDEDYGMIGTSDGREIYFHRNSLTNADFDQLQLQAEVRFNEEMGDQGPQATAVQLIGKHHIVG